MAYKLAEYRRKLNARKEAGIVARITVLDVRIRILENTSIIGCDRLFERGTQMKNLKSEREELQKQLRYVS